MNKYLILILLPFLFASKPATAQNTGGIGAQLIIDTAGDFTMPRIFKLIPGSPAYDSLRATDYIMMVDGVSCRDKAVEAVVTLIRGAVGTPVKIVVADTKMGAKAREYTLTRAAIQSGPAVDPTVQFYENCTNEMKALRKNGARIIKTYNSECGNFFFNFDADKGQYHVRIYSADDPHAASAQPAYSLTAKVFDSDHEAEATALGNPTQGDNTVTFSRNCVGVVGVTVNGDVTKCKAMYVLVYQ